MFIIENYYLLIIFLPLLGFLTIAFFGRYLGKYGSMVLSTGYLLCSTLLSVFAFIDIGYKKETFYFFLNN